MSSNLKTMISGRNSSPSSDRIYLHFLDREVCILSNSYALPASVFVDAFNIISSLSYETFVISGGHLFEHKAAKEIFQTHRQLFAKDQVLPVSSELDIFDFVQTKQEQYRDTENLSGRDYSSYFDDDWEEVFDRPITFQKSDGDTGRMLHAELLQRRIFKGDLDSRVREILEEREGKAITTELFHSTGRFDPKELRVIARHISQAYTGIYTQLYGNFVFARTGLVGQIIEHGLDKTHDFPVYERIYRKLALNELIFADVAEFAEYRHEPGHISFVIALRSIIAKFDVDPDIYVPNLIAKVARLHGYFRERLSSRRELLSEVAKSLNEMAEMDTQYLIKYSNDQTTFVAREGTRVSKSNTAKQEMPAVVLPIAAKQELSACRRRLAEKGVHVKRNSDFGGLRFDTFAIESEQGELVRCGLLLARGQGKADMSQLLNDVERNTKAHTVIMVGMMAAISGKARLLDVIIPRLVYDAVAQGVRDGKIIGEPEAYNMDPRLHHVVSSIEWSEHFPPDVNVVCHKKSVCVAAKFDDIGHELGQNALAIDPENIVGLEMEGAALGQMQAGQKLAQSRDMALIMIKGTADYAGTEISSDELTRLGALLNLEISSLDTDPTGNKQMKSALQAKATELAFDAAIALIKTL